MSPSPPLKERRRSAQGDEKIREKKWRRRKNDWKINKSIKMRLDVGGFRVILAAMAVRQAEDWHALQKCKKAAGWSPLRTLRP